jgi:hypothetical protein
MTCLLDREVYALATGRLRPICQGLLKPKTLFMTCLLDGEVYGFTMSPLPIETLIKSRASELDLTLAQVVSRTGMANTSKGLRRLEQLFDGDFVSSRGLIDKLPEALGLPNTDIEIAVTNSKNKLAAEADKAWRESFRPHAIVLTGERGRPRQITFAAICNAGRFVRITFPNNLPSTNYKTYAFAALGQQKADIRKYFYAIEGLVINWNPDSATIYDLTGAEISQLDKAAILGRMSFSLK